MAEQSEKKIRVLIVDDEADLREVVILCIETNFGSIVTEASSGNQAIEILKKGDEFDIIISDYNMQNGNGGDLFLYLQSINSKIPYVLFSTDNFSDHSEFGDGKKLFGAIEKPSFAEPIKEIFTKLTEHVSSAELGVHFSPPDLFIRVRLRTLLLLTFLPCDVYLKLSDEKFIKVLKCGDAFDVEQFNRFLQKDATFLYVAQTDADKFVSGFTSEVLSLLDVKADTETEIAEISENILNTVQQISTVMGFTEEVQRLTKKNVDLSIKFIYKNPKLSDLFARIQINPDSYISSHSVALGHLAGCIALQLGWDSDATMFKLSLAAMLHDITLSDQGIEVFNKFQKEAKDFLPENQQDQFLEHPKKAAEVIHTFVDIPPDVDTIVAQHHEKPDGSGFPSRLTHQRIAPLAALFIVAHDFIDFYFREKGKLKNIEEYFKVAEEKFSQGYFKKVLAALKSNYRTS